MAYTRIKICGITRPEHAHAAAEAGADAIGLVFYPPSPRAVGLDQAAGILAAVPPFVTTVALFVNATAGDVERVLEALPIDQLQFHGDESAAYCRQFHRPWFKAIRVRPGIDAQAASADYAGARAILLDAYRPGVPGGTGSAFDWSLVPASLPLPLVLAGGLTAATVAGAIAAVQPAAVDVSGGVESAPGIKQPEKIEAFVQAVRAADRNLAS
jgi:phosphoribosylanthranilate isomerase